MCMYIDISSRDLSFKKGDIIILRKKIDSNWYQGELNNQTGFFPASYVQVSVSTYHMHCSFIFRLHNEKEMWRRGELILISWTQELVVNPCMWKIFMYFIQSLFLCPVVCCVHTLYGQFHSCLFYFASTWTKKNKVNCVNDFKNNFKINLMTKLESYHNGTA